MTDTREIAKPGPGGAPKSRNPFARVALFVRQVVAELRKVVYPTQRSLLTYTVVVLFFVAVMIVFVTLLDQGFGWAMFEIFG
ncbi:MAG TPA: preprotein translocase subunit SecE [Jiangellaceae bacterium]|jgi:preprotein translocase subunit SecE